VCQNEVGCRSHWKGTASFSRKPSIRGYARVKCGVPRSEVEKSEVAK
jgi:hypothetical protein